MITFQGLYLSNACNGSTVAPFVFFPIISPVSRTARPIIGTGQIVVINEEVYDANKRCPKTKWQMLEYKDGPRYSSQGEIKIKQKKKI